MNSPFRFGFVGAGQIAHHSVDVVRAHGDADVVAVTDANHDRARELAESKSIATVCATATELFQRDDIDGVYIAVPNKFHAPLAIEALKAGKHVLLEKPFATSYAEALEVVQTAESTGRVFSLGMNYRLHAEQQKSKAVVRSGILGEVYHAKAWWYRRKGIPKLGTWFGDKSLAGGGCLYDIGVHYLDLVLNLLGDFEPVSVSGQTYTKFGNRGAGEGGWGMSDRGDIPFDVDDFASAFIRMKSGATVTLDVAWASNIEESNMNNVRLLGTEAGMLADPCQVFQANPEDGVFETRSDFDLPIEFPHCDRFHNLVNHVRGLEPLATTTREALAVQRILDAIAESSTTHREILIPPQ